VYNQHADIKRVLDYINSGFFNLDEPNLYKPIWDSLLNWGDRYFHLADFHSYLDCQAAVDRTYRDYDKWTRMGIMNIANMGWFSSDRAINEYARHVWGIKPCHVDLPPAAENGTGSMG
jgi:starch phosphorylase